jgi:hypothetical protein
VVAVEKAGRLPAVTAEDVADELAWCLGRFLDATADEPVMQRAKECLVLWQALRESDRREIDLTLLHP